MMESAKTTDIFEFDLTFQLPPNSPDPESHLDALVEAGCDDAVPGIGQRGYIALAFSREGETAEQAMNSAFQDVKAAIPRARFVEAKPDLAGLSEIAEACGCSRQNVRKHLVGKVSAPPPVHIGNPSLWHLAEVADFLGANMRLSIDERFVESAQAAQRLNVRERDRSDVSTAAAPGA
jgi:DNA-binding phage protein